MFRRTAQLESETRLVSPAASLDERWNDAAARLLESLIEGRKPPELEPELAQFLRRFICAKARRYARRLGERAHGVDVDDVAQRVFLQLFEHPPDREPTARPMRRLVSWVNTVTHNYLYDLASRPAERLAARAESGADSERATASDRATAEMRYAARQALLRVRPAIEKDYPLGLPLLTLLEESPHATSEELARKLGTSAANVDQMRSRIRRVLRRHLGDKR
jgi:RNA polymerase sigma factor (sigma-70 family)